MGRILSGNFALEYDDFNLLPFEDKQIKILYIPSSLE